MPSKLLPVTDTERMRLLHLARTLLRLSPVLTSSIGATFSFAFGVFFAGFRETRAPGNAIAITTTTTTAAKSGKSDTSRTSSAAAAAKWEVLPTWFGRIRAAALRTIFTAYNASIVLGAANALLLWSPASSPSPLSSSSSSSSSSAGTASSVATLQAWSRAAYAAGTLFSVAYYAYTITLKLVPLNFVIADREKPVADRERAELELARLDRGRTRSTGMPAAVCFFVGAVLWFSSQY